MRNLENNEKYLVRQLVAGDEDAFCKLYALYKNRLVYFASQFIKSDEYTEDLYQDTFMAIWQTRTFINPDTPFSTYVYTIMRNKVLNQLRRLEHDQHLKSILMENAMDYTDSTRDGVIANDLQEIINKALCQLTPRQKEIFEMSRSQQMSHKEIADKLEVSINAVQNNISLSLKSIRSYLSKYYGKEAEWIVLLICLQSQC